MFDNSFKKMVTAETNIFFEFFSQRAAKSKSIDILISIVKDDKQNYIFIEHRRK